MTEIFQGFRQGKRKTSKKRPPSERLIETSKYEPSVILVPPSKPPDIQDETVFQGESVINEDSLASSSESSLSVCETLLSGDIQTTLNGILGISENPCPSVPDQSPVTHSPTSGMLTSEDSNSLNPDSCMFEIAQDEYRKPFLVFDDGRVRSSDLQSE